MTLGVKSRYENELELRKVGCCALASVWSRSALKEETDLGRLVSNMLVNSFSGEDVADWVFFSICDSTGASAFLKLLLSTCDLDASDLLLDRDTDVPFDLISMGMTRDLVFLTSRGIIRTPGFGDGGLAVTVVTVDVPIDSGCCFLAAVASVVDSILEDLQLLIGAVGAGTGGRGGFVAAASLVSFSGEGVFEDLPLTTSSLMTFVPGCFDLVGLISSQELLDEVEPRRLSSLLVLLLLVLFAS